MNKYCLPISLSHYTVSNHIQRQMCLITHFLHNIVYIECRWIIYFFLLTPWDLIACLTFRGRLIYETHACFFMTCLIAFSAIGHIGCQNHKNSHLHRTPSQMNIRQSMGKQVIWGMLFPLIIIAMTWLIDVHCIFTKAFFLGPVWTLRRAWHTLSSWISVHHPF